MKSRVPPLPPKTGTLFFHFFFIFFQKFFIFYKVFSKNCRNYWKFEINSGGRGGTPHVPDLCKNDDFGRIKSYMTPIITTNVYRFAYYLVTPKRGRISG